MPGVRFFIDVCGVVLQYGLVCFMYYFLYRIIRLMYEDMGKGAGANARRAEARLIVLEAKTVRMARRKFSFVHKISIGRSAENDVVINDAFVSHHHAVIRLANHAYVLEDLASINHTYLNDCPVEGNAALASGDIIKIGLITFKFER